MDFQLPLLTVTQGGETKLAYSLDLKILLGMTALALMPALLMGMTAFTRVIIVLSILRQAIGLNATPTNQMLIGMALILSFFIMAPVFEDMNQTALQPYLQHQLSFEQALLKAEKPLKAFMQHQTREQDLKFFNDMAGQPKYKDEASIPLRVLMPAFLTSELKTAFQMGFALFLPFLIIDLIVASVLTAMGMMMLSPMMVALPFKILLFVLVDGWVLILGSLSKSFGVYP